MESFFTDTFRIGIGTTSNTMQVQSIEELIFSLTLSAFGISLANVSAFSKIESLYSVPSGLAEDTN
jgi:hypothetical protein